MSLLKLLDSENIHYKYALKQEINRAMSGNAAPHAYPPSIDLHPLINRYRNNLFFDIDSESEDGWYLFLKKKIKSAKYALSLGSGDARHEKRLTEFGLVEKWVHVDLIENPLDVFSTSGENEFIFGDLNFMELPENKFDLVYCNAMLHHIVNLEHLLSQIHKSLTPSGVLIVYEYSGENKWQWSEIKYNLLKQEIEQSASLSEFDLSYKRKTLYFMNERPLESIRSSELKLLINNYFEPKYENYWNRLIYPFINGLVMPRKYSGNEKVITEVIERAIDAEIMHKDNAELLPTELNGIYEKKKSFPLLTVTPWSEIEIEQNLGKIEGPISYRLYNFARKIKNRMKL